MSPVGQVCKSLWAWGATMLPAILLTLSHDQPHRTEGEIITK